MKGTKFSWLKRTEQVRFKKVAHISSSFYSKVGFQRFYYLSVRYLYHFLVLLTNQSFGHVRPRLQAWHHLNQACKTIAVGMFQSLYSTFGAHSTYHMPTDRTDRVFYQRSSTDSAGLIRHWLDVSSPTFYLFQER